MATNNFKTQGDFPLVVYELDTEAHAKELVRDGVLGKIEDYSEDDATDAYQTVIEDAREYLDKINDELTFYELDIESGYYDGIQLVVKDKTETEIDKDLDDETARYYYGDDFTADEIRKRFKQEKNRLTEIMKKIARDGDCESYYGCGVREVYAKQEDAQREMERIIKEEIKENPHIADYKQEKYADGFCAWKDGHFAQEHFCVYITERELDV